MNSMLSSIFSLFLNLSTITSLSLLGHKINNSINDNFSNEAIADYNNKNVLSLPPPLSLSLLSSPLLLSSTPSLLSSSSLLYSPEPTIYNISTDYIYEAFLFGLFTKDSETLIHPAIYSATLILATKEIENLYPKIKFNLKIFNGENTCINNNAGLFAAEEYYLRNVTAFFGPVCSFALKTVARMASYWNIPIFTAGGIGQEFSNKTLYSTLIRVAFSIDRVSEFLSILMKKFEWYHISLIVDESDLGMMLIKESIEKVFKKLNYHNSFETKLFIHSFFYNENMTNDYKKLLLDANRVSRNELIDSLKFSVFLLIVKNELIRDILLSAYELEMYYGDHLFLGIELVKKNTIYGNIPWFKPNDPDNTKAKTIYESYMTITVKVPTLPKYQTFAYEVSKLASVKYGTALDSNDVTALAGAFYDCVLIYAWILNISLHEEKDIKDGFSLIRILFNRTYNKGITGDIFINNNGDRENDYTLNDLDPMTGIMTPVGVYNGRTGTFEILSTRRIHWSNTLNRPPPDIPNCGFTGDAPHCASKESKILIYTLVVIILIIIISVISVFYFIKSKIKQETLLNDHWWQIKWSDLVFPEKQAGKRSTLSLGLSEASFTRTSKTVSTLSLASSMNTTTKNVTGALVASYKGLKVAVKPLNMKSFHINRTLLIEIKQMRDIVHENLVRFIGFCTEDPNFAIITELSIRGSLRDMLENDSINIDWMFKYSMITDIVDGMFFLHNSEIGYHGNLKSTKCVINGRFTVKVLGFGVRQLHKQIESDENINPRKLFWKAPEHLREADPFIAGSQKGDVYSFAIILQEIITRCGPFESIERIGQKKSNMEPDEILDRLRMGTIPPFRPHVSADEASKELIQLMHDCWNENPNARPDFMTIKPRLKKITKGISSRNFLDNLLNRMEQYTQNLEKMVEDKSQSFLEEKKKAEELLYQLLPKFVVEELKKGTVVKPESFDSVTIFFSDIVGFTALSAESTPMEVVDLLNDLYTCFDDIINNYDVYKVETIGDAYMVASGLPIRNGNEHAKEIARMAIDLRECMKTFKIRHKPERQLKVRIGIHSGACVAGIVGIKMPKYCLFGDTVNTASRMETNGEPLKIHISKECKDILDLYPSFIIVPRGEVVIKGKGIMKTYWLEGETKTST